jgi:hypothetical protein
MPAGTRQSTFSSARAGTTLILLEASMIVGCERRSERRLDHRGEPFVDAAQVLERAVGVRRVEAHGLQERPRRVGQVVRHTRGAEPLDVGQELEQRVVGERRAPKRGPRGRSRARRSGTCPSRRSRRRRGGGRRRASATPRLR